VLGMMAGAAVPDRDWPSVVPTPLLDVPMRDAAITRGPDGMYYLTGTLGVPVVGRAVPSPPLPDNNDGALETARSTLDFENTREVRLWKSTDLKTWADLGVIYDIHDPQYEDSGHWQRNLRFNPDRAEGDRFVRGITEPELHHIQGDWWLCFSINGEGTGLAKSTTGRPEGPYRHHARITAQGGSPSVFADDDGTVYWLIDGGRIAPLTDNLRALAKPPRQIVPAPSPMGRAAKEILAKNPGSAPLSDEPGEVGTRGAFLFKRDGYYFLTAAADHKRLLSRCNDTWIAYATSLDGPWSERHLMIHHGGGITVFEGPDNSLVTEHRGRYDSKLKQHATGPQLYATFAGADERAILRDRASFIPLEWVGPKRWDVEFFKHAESFPRKPQAVITVGGPFAHLKPLAGIGEVRDIAITLAPDGFYYLGGSLIEKRGELYLYRSPDLMKWELVGPFWTAPVVPAAKQDFANKGDPRTILWSGRLFHLHGKYYITCSLPGTGVVAFRSQTDSALGPYEELGKVGGVFAKDRNHSAGKSAFFTGPDGKLYCNGWMDWILQVAEVPASVLAKPGWPMNYRPVDIGRGNWMCRDDYGMVLNIEGLYVYTAYTGGSADAGNSMGTGHYGNDGDGLYAVGPTPWGPFRKFQTVHSVEYSELLKDKEGQWWAVVFFTDNSDPFWLRASLIPLDVRRTGNDLTIAVKETGYTERELRIMGGGAIAVVKTVAATLP
jgi:beta-xylosidase